MVARVGITLPARKGISRVRHVQAWAAIPARVKPSLLIGMIGHGWHSTREVRAMRKVLAIAALLIGGLIALPGTASASHITAGSCSGSLVATYNITHNGSTVGVMDLYYSSASGGTNCLKTRGAGSSYGYSDDKEAILIFSDGDTDPNDFDATALVCHTKPNCDSGDYLYYAGPVKLTNTDGRCVDIMGVTADGGPSLYIRRVYNIACG